MLLHAFLLMLLHKRDYFMIEKLVFVLCELMKLEGQVVCKTAHEL